jgi:hypothetical protein
MSRFSALIVAIIPWVAIVTPVAARALIGFIARITVGAPTAVVAAFFVRIIATVPIRRL